MPGMSPGTGPIPSARHRADDQQQDHRAADRDQPCAEVEELIDLADVERTCDEAADQGTEDADGGRGDAAARLGATRGDGPGDRAGEEPEDEPGDDSHPPGTLPPVVSACGEPALALPRSRVVAQVPED